MRQSTSHQAGTEEAQSPPWILPGLKFSGCVTSLKAGWSPARSFHVSCRAESFRTTSKAAMMAFEPSPATETWTGLPRTRSLNQITPTWDRVRAWSVGSGIRAQSAR